MRMPSSLRKSAAISMVSRWRSSWRPRNRPFSPPPICWSVFPPGCRFRYPARETCPCGCDQCATLSPGATISYHPRNKSCSDISGFSPEGSRSRRRKRFRPRFLPPPIPLDRARWSALPHSSTRVSFDRQRMTVPRDFRCSKLFAPSRWSVSTLQGRPMGWQPPMLRGAWRLPNAP